MSIRGAPQAGAWSAAQTCGRQGADMRFAAGGGQRIARVAQQSGEDGTEAPGRVQNAVVELPQGDDQALQ